MERVAELGAGRGDDSGLIVVRELRGRLGVGVAAAGAGVEREAGLRAGGLADHEGFVVVAEGRDVVAQHHVATFAAEIAVVAEGGAGRRDGLELRVAVGAGGVFALVVRREQGHVGAAVFGHALAAAGIGDGVVNRAAALVRIVRRGTELAFVGAGAVEDADGHALVGEVRERDAVRFPVDDAAVGRDDAFGSERPGFGKAAVFARRGHDETPVAELRVNGHGEVVGFSLGRCRRAGAVAELAVAAADSRDRVGRGVILSIARMAERFLKLGRTVVKAVDVLADGVAVFVGVAGAAGLADGLAPVVAGIARVDAGRARVEVPLADAVETSPVGILDIMVSRGDAGLRVLRDAVDGERGLLAAGRAVESLVRNDGVAVELVRAVFGRDPAFGGVGVDAGLRGEGRGRDRECRQSCEQQGDGFSEMVCDFHSVTSMF